MATRRYSRTALPPGVADLLPDLLDDIVEMWNLRTSGAVTPADVKGFVSLVVDMLPERRYCVSPSAHLPKNTESLETCCFEKSFELVQR